MVAEVATFGMGCFWGAEYVFGKVEGVLSTQVGYMGGWVQDPTYKEVCTGKTGHAEVVQVEFDTERVSFDQLLEVFWNSHDPTTRDRQGPDVGEQYRSVVFCHTPQQLESATRMKAALWRSGKFKRPIVTEIRHASKFYRAEEYHQKYLENSLGRN